MLNIMMTSVSLGLLWAVMTIGVFITFRILDTADLTVEGSITLGGATAARLISLGVEAERAGATLTPLLRAISNPFFATFAAVIAGMLAGLVTALLHTKLKIPPLLASILTMIGLYSVNLRVMGRASLSLLRIDTVFTPLEALGMDHRTAVLVAGALIVLGIVSVLYWFFGTEIGCAIRATGTNEKMVRAQGINTDNTKIFALVLSNGLVAFCGALLVQNQSYADMQMGTGAIAIGLASVIIGEVLFFRGSFYVRLCSIAVGAVAYRLIIAFVIQLGLNPDDLRLFTAITLALALSLPLAKKKLGTQKWTSPNGGGGGK
jgi:putative ABC transport system permease protein